MKPTQEDAKLLDHQDVLSKYQDEFYLVSDQIYLDGNSLGLCSKRAEKTFLEMFESWKRYQIDGWSNGKYPWFYLAEMLGAKMAPLVGAKKEEVVATGTTTVNLHQLIATFYHPEGKRTKIVANELDFPTDIYAIKSQLQLHGLDPEEHFLSVKSRQGRYIDEADIIACMQDDVALIILPTVLYRSGQLLDIELLTREAHKRGILIGFDACHSIGAVPHEFHQWGVDFAVWCSYKYLNSGPGSVAAIYVHEKHFGRVPGLAGWFGSDKERQFDMGHAFEPSTQAGAYQLSAPSILNAAPLIGSLSIFEEVGIESIRKKSLSLTRYMMELIESELQEWGFLIGNPMEDHRRGGHISLEHEEATRICKALKEANVIPDFRAPNVIRVAPIALYTSYQDVWEAVQRLKLIMVEEKYKAYSHERGVIA
ncbi:kynureninase [Thermoactinomyces sp. DSM 45892]|uniref:kynureninase n=1 Tax=Thermoactinomyces sp. DSM 45892 TaxID=1882753 RepID=UPI0008957DA0|nr:kynureninase [Thermoactinomyces sp. DSM 45892]SDZ30223.1 Kynureninase [Thermoactinomyces sp. DSM 45892]